MKYSIIVPVYNSEKYLHKCLDSIINQSYKNFEIIIVNDGSLDNSQLIIDKYRKEYPTLIKSYKKTNGGLSDARNYGVEKVTGDYIIFVDSDDYIDNKLLEKLNETINKNNDLDIISYEVQIVYPNNEKGEIIKKPSFNALSGEKALEIFIKNQPYFEPACFYAFNTNFWKQNDFIFAKGRFHEDFGLIPITILKSKKVSSIDFIGYYYYQSFDSITRNSDLQKENKKIYDLLFHFDNIHEQIQNTSVGDEAKQLLNSYIANGLLYRLQHTNSKYKKDFKNELKKRKITKLVIAKTFKEKIKKLLMTLKINLF